MVRCPFIEFAGEGEVGLVLVVLDVVQVSVNGSGGWRCSGVDVDGVLGVSLTALWIEMAAEYGSHCLMRGEMEASSLVRAWRS